MNKELTYDDKDFISIIDFYLFNCPVVLDDKTKVCNNAVSFEDKGLCKGKLTSLLNDMKKATHSKKIAYHAINSTDDVEKTFNNEEKNKSNRDENFEIIVFKDSGNLGKAKSIFYYIRNAFAHGMFKIYDDKNHRIYYLVSKKKDNVKCIMRLRKETLLCWISLFHESSKKVKASKRKRGL